MVRVITAVVVGYIVSVVLTIVGIFIAWTIFGVEGAFADNSTVASAAWSMTILVLGFGAAIAAGATAAKIDTDPRALGVKVLAGVLLVLGLGVAVMSMGIEPQPVPPEWADGAVTFMEAGEVASSPTWYNFAIAIVGAVGVLVGGNLVGKSD